MIDAACRSSDCNGLCFCNVYIAKELVSFILLRVDYKTTISNCRLVCKQWNEIITDPLFWKHKTALELIRNGPVFLVMNIFLGVSMPMSTSTIRLVGI